MNQLIKDHFALEEEALQTEIEFAETNNVVNDIRTTEELAGVITPEISAEALAITSIAIEEIHSRLGMKYTKTSISTESIKENLLKMIENFRKFFMNLWDKIKTFFFKIFDSIDKIEKSTKEILSNLSKVSKSEFKKSEIDDGYISHTFGEEGSNKPLEFSRVKEIYSNHSEITSLYENILKDTMGVRDNITSMVINLRIQHDSGFNNSFAKLREKVKPFTSEIIKGTNLVSNSEKDGVMHVVATSKDLAGFKRISYDIEVRKAANYLVPKISITTQTTDTANTNAVKILDINELKELCGFILDICAKIKEFKTLVSKEDKLRISENEAMGKAGTFIGSMHESLGSDMGPVLSHVFGYMRFFQAPSVFALGNLNSINTRACIGGFKYIKACVSSMVITEQTKSYFETINEQLAIAN